MKPGGTPAAGGKFGMLKDKRVLIGVAAAGGLGLVVMLKRGSGTAAGSSTDGGQAITPADYNSSGVDSYNAISQIGQAWGDQFQAYTDQLGNLVDKLGNVNGPPDVVGGTPIPIKPAPGPKPKPAPKPAPKPTAKPSTVKVTKFTSKNPAWNSTLSGIASHYHTSVSNLYKLNPSLHGKSTIHPNQTIRYK